MNKTAKSSPVGGQQKRPAFPWGSTGVLLRSGNSKLCCLHYPQKLCRGEEEPGYIYWIGHVDNPHAVTPLTELQARRWFKTHVWRPDPFRDLDSITLTSEGSCKIVFHEREDLRTECPDDEGAFANELLSRFISGETDVFDALHYRYGNLVLGTAGQVLENHHDAEEAAQEAWLRVWNEAERWDGENAIRFIVGIAKYTAKKMKWQNAVARLGGWSREVYENAVRDSLYSTQAVHLSSLNGTRNFRQLAELDCELAAA